VDKPIFLAGGLTAENVTEAIQKVKPYAVDTSGGVETDGTKDAAKIEKYIRKIREVI
jgi:phosphoribosylanthranilate isomerase